MRCIKCGAEISDNEKFCSVCGTPVDDKLKVVDNVTLSDYAVDKSDGSEKKQNSNKKSAEVNNGALTDADAKNTQGNVIVSDITIEEFTVPDETISDDVAPGDFGKNKTNTKKSEKKPGVKSKKKEKEIKEKKPKKIETEKAKEDKKKKEKKREIIENTANKKETDSESAKVDFSQVDNKVVENVASDGSDNNDKSKVLKTDKNTNSVHLTVKKTTTISDEFVKSNENKIDYEIKQEPEKEKRISVAGKNLTFIQSNKISFVREDKHLSPGAKANIERRKAEAAETLKKRKSDEERINDAVKAIKESVIRNGKEGWICRVCGHYNPSTVTSCLKCGRDRVRMAKLKARGYDPNAVPKLVKHNKKRMRPKKERIVYLSSDKKAEVQTNDAPVASNTPIVHNYIYTGAYSGVYKNTQQVSFAKDPYVMVEHSVRNRVFASICAFLMFLFILISLFATAYISTDGSVVEGFSGMEIISSVIVGLLGGTKSGSKYFDLFQKEITTNGWIIENTGLVNQIAIAGLLTMLVLLVAVVIALVDFIRCIMRIVKGKAMNGRFHILSFIILVGVCLMVVLIWIHNGFAFYQEGSVAFWGHQPSVTVTLDGTTITEAVYSTGIAYILTLCLIVARFIMGFFFAKPERMRLSEASERYPLTYPQKYYSEHTEISPEDYAIIMQNSGALSRPVSTMQSNVMVQRTATMETLSNFDRPVRFEETASLPNMPSHKEVNTQVLTKNRTVENNDKSVVTEYKFVNMDTLANTDATITEDLDKSRGKSKKEGK